MIVLFIACGPCTRTILAAARPLGLKRNTRSNTHPHDTSLTSAPSDQVHRYSSFDSTEGFDCSGVFSSDTNIDINYHPTIGIAENYITTDVGKITATSVLESQYIVEDDDQNTNNYSILSSRKFTPPPGRPVGIH